MADFNIQIYGDGKESIKFVDKVEVFMYEAAQELGIVLTAFHASVHKNDLDKKKKNDQSIS